MIGDRKPFEYEGVFMVHHTETGKPGYAKVHARLGIEDPVLLVVSSSHDDDPLCRVIPLDDAKREAYVALFNAMQEVTPAR